MNAAFQPNIVITTATAAVDVTSMYHVSITTIIIIVVVIVIITQKMCVASVAAGASACRIK
jgi:hypothetical protein